MSYLKINSDLFLGSQELNRWKKFLDDDGFRQLLLQNTVSFGIINNSKAGQWDNFLISQGTNTGTVKNNAGYAIDINGQLITRAATDNIPLINDNNWYWIKVAHQYNSNEVGTVSVDGSGNLTGSGTLFTQVLRGAPNNQMKISFPNASLNTQEYFVQSVISDTSAVLNGSFQIEANLNYAIIGAFTPDIAVPSGSKYPFQYSSCLMTLVLETVLDTPPTLITNQEFVIARVKRNGSTITIQDKRSFAVFRTKPDFALFNIAASTNPLIGVEAIKYDDANATKDKNLLYLAWAFRSTNWTINTSINQVTINGGQGGKYKSTIDFSNGDFDGWRIYTKDGSFSVIRQSSISGTQINLILDTLNADLYSDTTQQLLVTPNAESIDLSFTANPGDTDILPNQVVSFPINIDVARIPLIVYKSPTCSYNIKYRYKTFETYSLYTAIPTDTTHGLYNEAQFDVNGILVGSPTRTTYTSDPTNGFITLTLASNAYTKVIAALTTGDIFGLNYVTQSNAAPNNIFQVGTNDQIQIFKTTGTLVLSIDQYIGLNTVGAKAGNSFVLDFRGVITQGAFNLRINQDFVNVGSPGTNLVTFSNIDFVNSANSNLVFKFIFDGTNWIFEKFISIPIVANKTPAIAVGNALTTLLTIPSTPNQSMYLKVRMLATYVSGSGNSAGDTGIQGYTVVIKNISGTPTVVNSTQTDNVVTVYSPASLTFSVSGSNILVRAMTTNAGVVFNCTAYVEYFEAN